MASNGGGFVSSKFQGRAGIIVAALTLLTAGLGVLSAYYGVKAANARQERDQVRGTATTLRSQQADLAGQLEDLKAENADLRQRLQPDGANNTGSAPQSDVQHRSVRMPLSETGDTYLMLDRGEVSSSCCSGDVAYGHNRETGIPEITITALPFSIDVPSAAASEAECVQAVKTSPSLAPIRSLGSGTLICASTSGGTSLLQIAGEPAKNGTLKIRQTFWPT